MVLWEEQLNRDEKETASTKATSAVDNKDNHKSGTQEVAKAKQEVAPDEVETEKIRNYNIGRLYRKPLQREGIRYGVQEMSEDEIAALITQRSNKLSMGDQRIVEDCTAIINLLRRNPTPNGNFGVRRLYSEHKMVIEGIPHSLWRFSPNKTQGLELSHPTSQKLRIVYGVYRKDDTKLVVLDGDGIYTHQEFDRIYSDRKK